MSVKTNLLIAAAAVLGVSSAYAGGPEMMAAPAAPSFTPYFYGELGLGYAQTDYSLFTPSGGITGGDNKNGGLSYAGDFGYQFMPNLAVELGGGYLPKFKNATLSEGDTDYSTSASSWYAYGAGRIDTDVINDNINVYAKAGVAYRNVDLDVGNGDYWAPIFGAGVSYDVRDNIYVALEMNYIGGNNDFSSSDKVQPSASIYMAKVGYQFNF